MCRLKHRELLDAAHIIPDSDDAGVAEVSNGIALCKIHHAAFDKKILGIRPDYVIDVRRDILEETDGPMLKYGLQKMSGLKIIVPSSVKNRPRREALETQYELFRQARTKQGDVTMNIRFEYLYRDAANYKNWGDIVFSNRGKVSADVLTSQFRSYLIDGEFFVAEQMDVPSLKFFQH